MLELISYLLVQLGQNDKQGVAIIFDHWRGEIINTTLYGFANSLTKLWFVSWLTRLWQCTCNKFWIMLKWRLSPFYLEINQVDLP